jgi:hypothetical protein
MGIKSISQKMTLEEFSNLEDIFLVTPLEE